MSNVFISKIHIKKCRHLENIDIELSKYEIKHLVLTGKNGSGKTSLAMAIANHLYLMHGPGSQCHVTTDGVSFLIPYKSEQDYVYGKLNIYFGAEKLLKSQIVNATERNTCLNHNAERIDTKNLHFDHLLSYLPADRRLSLRIPKSIEKVDLEDKKLSSNDFLAYMVFLRHQMTDALYDGDTSQTEKLKTWFDNLLQMLRKSFNEPHLQMKYDRELLNFRLTLPEREEFMLNEMADGYSSLLGMVAWLIMKMDGCSFMVYDKPGIVVVDEIETHLHVELQKLVLPFLTGMFPNIQFIVTTHSPFVISSLANAVVYDLEKQIRVEDMTAYSYEGIVEHYYDTSQYSKEAEKQFGIYMSLACKDDRTQAESMQFINALTYLKQVPDGAAQELVFAFREMEAKRNGGCLSGQA